MIQSSVSFKSLSSSVVQLALSWNTSFKHIPVFYFQQTELVNGVSNTHFNQLELYIWRIKVTFSHRTVFSLFRLLHGHVPIVVGASLRSMVKQSKDSSRLSRSMTYLVKFWFHIELVVWRCWPQCLHFHIFGWKSFKPLSHIFRDFHACAICFP